MIWRLVAVVFAAILWWWYLNQQTATQTATVSHSCDPSQFSVSNGHWENEPDLQSIRVTGSLNNNCNKPAYATVQFVYRDDTGKIISSSGELYLAGNTDIPPHTPRQFLWTEHLDGIAKHIDWRIMHVHQESGG
jgi:hypothetical protein